MQPPTFIQAAETTWTVLGASQTTKTTSSFDVQAGDVLVAYCMLENGSQSASISGGSLSWTQQQQISEGNGYARVYLWTAVVDVAKSMSVSFTKSSTISLAFGGNVLTFRGSDGVGASAKFHRSSGALEGVEIDLVTTQENSAVIVASTDWEVLDGASRSWKTNGGAFTELTYQLVSEHYTVYGGYHADTGAAANREYGLTAPLDQTYSIVAIEIFGKNSEFPTTLIQDNFDRGGSLYGSTASGGGSWGALPTNLSSNEISIVSDQVTGTAGPNTYSSAYMSHAMYGPDAEVYATVVTKGTTGSQEVLALFARLRDPEILTMTGYYVEVSGNGDLTFVRVNEGGVQVVLAYGNQPYSDGDSFGFTVTGTTTPKLTAWYKPAEGSWIEAAAYTDMLVDDPPSDSTPFLGAGYIGLETRDNTSRIDNFGGGTDGGDVPTFPNTGILDDFNRANSSTLGANWSTDPLGASGHAFNIVSNEATTDNGWYCEQWWNPSAFGPDSEAYVTVVDPPTGHINCSFGLCVRLQSPGSSAVDGYRLVIQPDAQTWEIDVLTNGVETPIGASVTQAVSAGDKVGLLAIGDTLYAFHYTAGVWSLVLSRTDSTYQSAGNISLWAYDPNNTAVFDDFGGGTIDSVPFASSPNFLPFFI